MTYQPSFPRRHEWLQVLLIGILVASVTVGVVAAASGASWSWMLLVPIVASCVLLCVWFEG